MDLLTIVQVIQSLWVLFIVIMLFGKFRIGVAGYLAYMYLVPFMMIEFGDFVLQWNFINIILLVAFIFYRQRHYNEVTNYDWRPLSPFIIYFVCSLLIMPFQDGLPFSESINIWRTQVMKYLILPFVIWNDIIVNKDSLKLYRNVTIICIIVAVLYGLFLTLMPGYNPYMVVLSLANGEEFNLAYAAGNGGLTNDERISDGRIFGRISSVFSHPMSFGLFLGFALLYLYRNKENINKKLFWGLSIFILIDMMVCGVRSVLVAILIAILFMLIQSRNVKLFVIILLLGYACWVLASSLSPLGTYLSSIYDPDGGDVKGSSIEMRLSQLEGCFRTIQATPLEGKGFGWSGYYVSQHGGHPTMLFFESLIFVILCDSGIIGIILWIIMSIMILRYNNRNVSTIAISLNTLFIFYIAYACITGEYGYMQYFILFYILMLGENLIWKKRTQI